MPCSTPTDLPFSDSAVGCRCAPFFETSRVGVLNSLSENAICSARAGVIDIDDSTPSNFFAFSAGIIPSKSFSIQTHFAFRRAQISLPRSTSKPTTLPLASFDSNGG